MKKKKDVATNIGENVVLWCKLTISFIYCVAVSLCFSLLLDHYHHIQIVGALVWTMDPIQTPDLLRCS